MDNRVWINSPHDIKEYVISFYKNLFTTDYFSSPKKHQYNLFSRGSLREKDYDHLDSIFTQREIKSILFSFNPNKAPGPDRIRLFMYKRYWDIMGQVVYKFVTETFQNVSMDPSANLTS